MMFSPKIRTVETPPVPRDTATPGREPVIGLALGSGSARGWAHIGILKRLDEAGIRPKVIAGTSIGAVVGGSWAAGKLAELEEFARSISKRSMLGMMDWSIAGSGLLSGDRLRKRLEERLQGTVIEDLPIRFAAIATEIKTGHEIWLTRGSLTDAMRASYALPGVFVPVNVKGRWLIDGALSNPVPVGVARALGAEMIIAVNLHTDVLGRSGVIHEYGGEENLRTAPSPEQDEARRGLFSAVSNRIWHPFGGSTDEPDPRPGIMSVMIDAFHITQDRLTRSRLAGDPPDVVVGPKIGGIGLTEFHRAEEAIAAGYAAANQMIDEIQDIRRGLTIGARKS
jgi:NTE family protein